MRSHRVAAALIAFAIALTAFASSAQAEISGTHMRGKRYCEIFTVFLAPSPIARVNNTSGLNNCRQGWWDSLSTSEIAGETGSDLVLLNGPRYWLMDKVKVTDPGPIVDIAGKQLREVATIDLNKVGLAPPPAYTPVKITRGTKYTFLKDKPLFQLVDPEGRVYVMQAWSQIVDPDLGYDELAGLGPRVGLPDGWKYRTRKLDENLVLRANGQATIIQDVLKDTYQRIPARFSE
jgi:hypothetical protein